MNTPSDFSQDPKVVAGKVTEIEASTYHRRAAGMEIDEIAAEDGVELRVVQERLQRATPIMECDDFRKAMFDKLIAVDRKTIEQLDKHMSVGDDKLANPHLIIAHLKGRQYYTDKVDVNLTDPQEIERRRIAQLTASRGKVKK